MHTQNPCLDGYIRRELNPKITRFNRRLGGRLSMRLLEVLSVWLKFLMSATAATRDIRTRNDNVGTGAL